METNELREKLQKIVEKRSRSEQLTNEERILADQIVDKLLTSKSMLNKVFEHKVGDDLKKADESPTLAKPKSTVPSFEGTPPQNRGFEGGYDSKADISERGGVSPDPGNYTDSPIRQYPEYFSEEGKQTPTEDNSGTIKAEYETEEYADTDGKPYENPYYEEDRVGRYIEGRAPKTGSIKVHKGDVVTKQMGSNTLVGWILKVHDPFNGNQAVMVKWSNHTFSHENVANITVLKAQGSKSEKIKTEEETYSSPPVKKQEDVKKVRMFPKLKPGSGRKPAATAGLPGAAVEFGAQYSPATQAAGAVGTGAAHADILGQMGRRTIRALRRKKSAQTEDVRKGKLVAAARAAERLERRATVKKELETRPSGLKVPKGGSILRPSERNIQALERLGIGFKRKKVAKSAKAEYTQKGEKPPSEWLDRCVENLKGKGSVDEPYAVCTATYQKMKDKFASGEDIEKDVMGNIIIHLTPEDLEKDCPECAEKMRKRNVKFLKNTVDIKELEKYGLSSPTSRVQRPISSAPTQVGRIRTTQRVRRPQGIS